MSTNKIIRWSGLFQILGAAFFGTAVIMISFTPVTHVALSPTTSLLFLLLSICWLLSFPAMYARQASAAGWLGLAGHALLQTGILLFVVIASTPLLFPSLIADAGQSRVVLLLGLAFFLGLLLTGIGTLRARVFPRWASILLLAATAGFVFDFFIAEFLPVIARQVGAAILAVLLALALAWIGLFMSRT
jgi:hypothetical protein